MKIDNDSIKKTIALYGASVLTIVLGFAISVFNTRILGKESFGDFKLIQTVFRFTGSLVSVGVFISLTRMLAIAKDKIYKQNLLGFFVVALVIASCIGFLLIIIFSYTEPYLFADGLDSIYKKYAIFIFAILGSLALTEILKGLNHIYTLAILNTAPSALYLASALIIDKNTSLYLEDIILIFYGIQSIFILIIIYKLKPKFVMSKKIVSDVIHENRTNGKPIYFGSLAGVATAHIASFSIAYFLDNTQVGFYTLALTVCSPILIIPSVLGTSFFKKFTDLDHIPKKVVVFSITVTLIALIVFYLLIDRVFLLFYTEEYAPAINISKILIFSFLLHGLGDLINRFLGAKGKGKLLRNAAFIVGIVNVLGYVVLVYFFGLIGAIITKIAASGAYLLMMYYYYIKFIKQNTYV